LLALSRKEGEAIVITVPPSDKPTVIRLVALAQFPRNRMHIGIDAPRSTEIWREELLPLDKAAS
jgi:sRNA-binding carbon storage regulator CsrA